MQDTVRGFESNARRRRVLRWVLVGLICSTLVPSNVALAAEKTIQLAPLLGSTVSVNRRDKGFAPITVQVVLANEKSARRVCAFAPRLRDAIIVHLARRPLRQKLNGRLDLTGVGERLRAAMQSAVTTQLGLVKVIDGSIRNSKMATGSAAKLPSFRQACVLIVP